MVELKLAESKGIKDADGNGIDLTQHRAAMQQALGSGFVDRCRRDLSPTQIRCGLEATDSAALTSCAQGAK